VFLSLILLLIVSLICTIIEASRISAAKVTASRALATALDSALAGYYGPLWNDYHVFGLYTGSSDMDTNNSLISQTVKNYMEYTLNPTVEWAKSGVNLPVDLYDLDIEEVYLQNLTRLMDYEGELFINQAVEYMKYAQIGDGLKLFLDKLSILKEPAKVSALMEEKQKVEEELLEIDEEILNLMMLYDGIVTSKKGVEPDKNGRPKTKEIFIKKICFVDITMQTVAINNDVLFLAQKDKFINPLSAYFTHIKNSFSQIYNAQMSINEIYEKIEALEEQASLYGEYLRTLLIKEEKSDEDLEAIKMLSSSINECESKINNLKEEIRQLNDLIKAKTKYISNLDNSFNSLLLDLLPLHDEAMQSINKILDKSFFAQSLLNKYETLLESSKDGFSEGIYDGLKEELNQLKKYTTTDNNGYDFEGMKRILEANKSVLSDTLSALKTAKEALDLEDYTLAQKYYYTAEECLLSYQIQGLALDYSTLVYDKDNKREVLDKVNDIIARGISNLILDPDEISESKLVSTYTLPTVIHGLTDDNNDYTHEIRTFFSNAKKGFKNITSALFDNFREESDIKRLLTDDLNGLVQILLFEEYLDEHFSSYQPRASKSDVSKATAIEYELEYLIVGKYSDAANLNAIIARILFIRMIFDFVTILADKNARNEAKLVASAMVGFTGLPILLGITQMLVMFIWSFAEALLDTCALIMDKEVPIIKKKPTMTFSEIFMLTRDYLRAKASALSETQEVSLSYGNYLKIFLLMTSKEKLAYRAMDLIQENIKLRYDDREFSMANCLYGFKLKAVFEIEKKFTGFKFLQGYYDLSLPVFKFSAIAADAY